jgi:uncharacterized protein YndB with AHSA1/START domain
MIREDERPALVVHRPAEIGRHVSGKEWEMRVSALAVLLSAVVLGGPTAGAEVIDRSDDHFLIRNAVTIGAPPNRVFLALTMDVGRWWDAAHTFFGSASNLSIESKVGGCFCERLQDGRAVEHMRVVYVEPGRMLRLVGGIGPLQEFPVNGVATWTLSETPAGTDLEMTYSVAGHRIGTWADGVDTVLSEQVNRLKAYVENDRGGLK